MGHVTAEREGAEGARRRPAPQHDARRGAATPVDRTGLFRLQQQVGNREVVRMLGIQARLEVGRVDDPLEAEADHAACEVLRALRTPETPTAEDTENPPVRRRVSSPIGPEGGEVGEHFQRALDAARPAGVPLPHAVGKGMGAAFGADFSDVRVHSGPVAAHLNRQVGATAFTAGRDIFFRDGMPDAGAAVGQHLLAHELAHTIQQGAASVGRRSLVEPSIRRQPEDAEAGDEELDGEVPDLETSDEEGVVKGPRDAVGPAYRQTRAGGPARTVAGSTALSVKTNASVTASSIEGMPAGDKDDSITSTGTVDWSNPGGKKTSPFGSESFAPSLKGIKWKENAGKITLSLKINAKCSWGVKTNGQKDIASASSSAVKADTYEDIVDDLTPVLEGRSWRAPRGTYWSKKLCERHEKFHSTDDRDWVKGAGLKVVTDYLDGVTVTLTDDDKKSKSAKKRAIHTQVKTAVADAKDELERANGEFYTGGQADYVNYDGEYRANLDGRQPYLDLAKSVEDRGKQLAAKKAAKEKAKADREAARQAKKAQAQAATSAEAATVSPLPPTGPPATG